MDDIRMPLALNYEEPLLPSSHLDTTPASFINFLNILKSKTEGAYQVSVIFYGRKTARTNLLAGTNIVTHLGPGKLLKSR
jgi:hypothetical protein